MFNGTRLNDSILPLKRILSSVWCDALLLPEQERFATIVARYERLRSQAREAERQVEGLFRCLLALSFTEELRQNFGGDSYG